jgi:hypothetical protein
MQASSNDLVFALPAGYIEQRNGEVIIPVIPPHAADAQQ